MDMTLDDIIKMSKRSSRMKKSAARKKSRRAPIKSQTSRSASNGNSKIQNFMDSRSALRQSVLATKRSNYRENQFPNVSEVVKEAVHAPFNRTLYSGNNQRQRGSFTTRASGAVNGKDKLSKQRPQTLDDRFASMKWKKILEAHEINGLQTAKRRPIQQRLGAVLQREQRPGREQWSCVAGLRAALRPCCRKAGWIWLEDWTKKLRRTTARWIWLEDQAKKLCRTTTRWIWVEGWTKKLPRTTARCIWLLKTKQRSYAGQWLGGIVMSNRGFRSYRK